MFYIAKGVNLPYSAFSSTLNPVKVAIPVGWGVVIWVYGEYDKRSEGGTPHSDQSDIGVGSTWGLSLP